MIDRCWSPSAAASTGFNCTAAVGRSGKIYLFAWPHPFLSWPAATADFLPAENGGLSDDGAAPAANAAAGYLAASVTELILRLGLAVAAAVVVRLLDLPLVER